MEIFDLAKYIQELNQIIHQIVKTVKSHKICDRFI